MMQIMSQDAICEQAQPSIGGTVCMGAEICILYIKYAGRPVTTPWFNGTIKAEKSKLRFMHTVNSTGFAQLKSKFSACLVYVL